ncbi:hypothetical protein RF11_09295 [Thelohanellus kitauei]|uniref:EGF-like domain-containing protein n=1 Tax=Thelohanellus kitauei TaxID=669202 RepID=A0A0C2MKF8_THEKT|nr:hypothetical protein RF11_09295 [Thelohanellus kitauei]
MDYIYLMINFIFVSLFFIPSQEIHDEAPDEAFPYVLKLKIVGKVLQKGLFEKDNAPHGRRIQIKINGSSDSYSNTNLWKDEFFLTKSYPIDSNEIYNINPNVFNKLIYTHIHLKLTKNVVDSSNPLIEWNQIFKLDLNKEISENLTSPYVNIQLFVRFKGADMLKPNEIDNKETCGCPKGFAGVKCETRDCTLNIEDFLLWVNGTTVAEKKKRVKKITATLNPNACDISNLREVISKLILENSKDKLLNNSQHII